jgi:hypothetical protein
MTVEQPSAFGGPEGALMAAPPVDATPNSGRILRRTQPTPFASYLRPELEALRYFLVLRALFLLRECQNSLEFYGANF